MRGYLVSNSNPRRGKIPSPLGDDVDWRIGVDRRLDELEIPSGSQRNQTVNYLGGLKTVGASAPLLLTGTVPNTSTYFFFNSVPPIRVDDLDVPSGRLLVSVTAGEASITPGGSYVITTLGFSVYDATNTSIPTISFVSAQSYTNQRKGDPLSTGQQYVEFDTSVYPGPYSVRALFGMWVSTLNTTPCSTQFSDMSMVVQVVGSGGVGL